MRAGAGRSTQPAAAFIIAASVGGPYPLVPFPRAPHQLMLDQVRRLLGQHECSQTAGNGIPLRGASEFSGVRQIVPCVTAQLAMQGLGSHTPHPGHQNVAHRCLELQTRTNVEPWLSVTGPENRLSMGSDPVRLSKVGNHAKSNRRKKRRRPVVRNQREELMIRNSLTSLEGCTVRSVQLWSQR